MIDPVQRQQLGFCCFGEDLRALLALCRVADRTLLPQSVTGQHTCFATCSLPLQLALNSISLVVCNKRLRQGRIWEIPGKVHYLSLVCVLGRMLRSVSPIHRSSLIRSVEHGSRSSH